jgi:hypothetical protein
MKQEGACPPQMLITIYTDDREHRVNDRLSEMTGESGIWITEQFPDKLLNHSHYGSAHLGTEHNAITGGVATTPIKGPSK